MLSVLLLVIIDRIDHRRFLFVGFKMALEIQNGDQFSMGFYLFSAAYFFNRSSELRWCYGRKFWILSQDGATSPRGWSEKKVPP
jgi:hypothetical protein